MLFQTGEFLIFFVVVLLAVASLRRRRQQHVLLLLASYLFYGWWDVRFLVLIVLSSMIDFAAALGIRGERLAWPERLRMSGFFLAFSSFCLGIDWPALQAGDAVEFTSLFLPTWPGVRVAWLTCVAFAIGGPVLYELGFRCDEQRRRRVFVLTSVVANLGVLGFFKYYDFFRDNWTGIGQLLGFDWAPPLLSVALPVGISFYTFQTMSYTIDVYRGQVEPERSFLRLSLYVAYFPQLIAGPILRPAQFLPALDRVWCLHRSAMLSGFHLVLVGLFKKVLIADRVGPLVDLIFEDPASTPSVVVMLGAALFAVQIYCDFSGYTDIARGISRMFGIEIPLNFDFPYFSRSITEFWRRWHISLSTWLRDYLYIPLGGNRFGVGRTYFNLLATMVLGGLWHGAAWNFVLWGAYQGGLLAANRWLAERTSGIAGLQTWLNSRFGQVTTWAVTVYLTLLGWIIFRVTDPDRLAAAVKQFVVFDGRFDVAGIGLGNAAPFGAVAALALFVVLHAVGRFRRRWPEMLDSASPRLLPWIYLLLGLLFFFLWPSTSVPFIYFQF